ncbi:MAG: hypothetical protein HQL76_05940 [Magnetococcales bacterium]|nr:hypothetical protein [Magnetococcales bacterium]
MTDRRLMICHLVFTGPEVEPAVLEFGEGSNLVWGASNTGKSFALKAIDFMLGGSKPLPDIEERHGYDAIWCGLRINEVGDFTVRRAILGGSYTLYEGLHVAPPGDHEVRTLSATHDASNKDNLSNFLLDHLGLSGKFVATNAEGEKDNLSFRGLANILLVDETTILAERSPIERGQHTKATTERSVFRLLLTGIDDSAITTVPKPINLKTEKVAKLGLLDEMIADVEARLSVEFPDAAEFDQQDERLTRTLEQIQIEFEAAQGSIRSLLEEKKRLSGEIPRIGERLDDIRLHLDRFSKLDRAYESDIQRLEAIEEAGFLVSLGSGRDCPLCGAKPDTQLHQEGMVNVEQTRMAAFAETQKITRLRSDLKRTVHDLRAEQKRLESELPSLLDRLKKTEKEILDLTPQVDQTRRTLGESLAARDRVRQGMALLDQLQSLREKKKETEEQKTTVPKGDKPRLDLIGTIAYDFCRVVGHVLSEWQFPGDHQVVFDDKTFDLRIDGKLRTANGKGVRAVTHAAFKVAMLIYCRERNLPHPGFVVLDTPLLTYRDPIKNTRHGELSSDEQVLANTPLKQNFFEHLHRIQHLGQFIIFENIDLPDNIRELAKVEVFVGDSEGRSGLFPLARSRKSRQ